MFEESEFIQQKKEEVVLLYIKHLYRESLLEMQNLTTDDGDGFYHLDFLFA